MSSTKIEPTDLTNILVEDLKYITSKLNEEPALFWRRSYIKTVASLIESEVYIFKSELIEFCKNYAVQIEPEVQFALEGKKFELNDKGKVKEKNLQVSLETDIRFTLDQLKTKLNLTSSKSFGDTGWSALTSTISTRNRLTHPKSVADLNVSNTEIEICTKAFEWFYEYIIEYKNERCRLLEIENKKLDEKIKKHELII